MKQEKMAPGHVYQPRLGTGIEWLPGEVKLWEGGAVTASAAHQTATPVEFWRELEFARCFPDVTHWWFRSAWTQCVRLTLPIGVMDDGAAWGWMQFIDKQVPAQIYTVAEAMLPVIAVPYPPNEIQPVNLPLRLALSRLVAGVITGDVIPDQWMIVTSLVKRDELETAFPKMMGTLPWHMEGIATSLRDALCLLQGLTDIAVYEGSPRGVMQHVIG